ncbi:MAG: hypothetical protein RLZZ15_4187 [Verrucomicrobiota bacterium]|jgi:hypothetical protein
MLRRRCFAVVCLLALFAAASAARAGEAAFVHVWPGWREAESFERIGEFLGGAENPGAARVVRTRADARAGYYFLVRFAATGAPAGARFELSIVRPDAPEPKKFSFAADASASRSAAPPASDAGRAGAAVFHLGLTGADWPGGKTAHPVAWRLALLAADGRVLAAQESFLWEMPAK